MFIEEAVLEVVKKDILGEIEGWDNMTDEYKKKVYDACIKIIDVVKSW